jgi:hypothetical protein
MISDISKKLRCSIKPLAVLLLSSLTIMYVSAGAVTGFSDTLSTAKIATSSNHSFVFTTPTGIASGATVIFTFPSEFVIPAGLTFTDVDINNGSAYAASSTLAAAPSGATVGVVRTSTSTLTITNGTTVISPGATVYVRVGTNATNQSTGSFQITNATTTGNKSIGLTGNFGDTGTTTVNMITDDTVNLNAVVPQSLTFTISSTSTYFGNLSSGSAKYASSTGVSGDAAETVAHTLGVSSNAPSGYTITVKGQTLTSLQNSANTIPAIGGTAASSTAGTSQFGLRVTASGGTGSTVASPYNFSTSYGYNATATTTATLATGSGATNTTTYSLYYVANIAALQEAGTYSAGLTYVATANF